MTVKIELSGPFYPNGQRKTRPTARTQLQFQTFDGATPASTLVGAFGETPIECVMLEDGGALALRCSYTVVKDDRGGVSVSITAFVERLVRTHIRVDSTHKAQLSSAPRVELPARLAPSEFDDDMPF